MELVKIINGKPYTSSRIIAQYFNKSHKNIVNTISNLGCTEEFNRCNYLPINFKDNYGKERSEFAITQDGCILLVTSFTGKKAAKFKKRFKLEFDYLAAIIREPMT